MIVLNEFIWRCDQYVYHITTKDAMPGIQKFGLIPLCGDRCKQVGDTEKRVYFIYNLSELFDWIKLLYGDINIKDIEVLRFNLKNRRLYILNDQEFYLKNAVKPEKIEYLRLYNPDTLEYVPLNMNGTSIIQWCSMSDYIPFNSLSRVRITNKKD